MSETQKEIDYRALPAGSWSPQILGGQPVGFFVTRLFQRAGVPEADPLWQSCEWVHPSHQGECVRLPDVFPPDDWESLVPRLQTVGDWLDLVDKVETSVRKRGEVLPVAAASVIAADPSPQVGTTAVPSPVVAAQNPARAIAAPGPVADSIELTEHGEGADATGESAHTDQ